MAEDNMKFYNKVEAKEKINVLGAQDAPFLFVTDYIMEHNYVSLLSEVCQDEVLYSFPSWNNDEGQCPDLSVQQVEWLIHPKSVESYQRKFQAVQRHLHAGNSFLTNLTCRIPVSTNLSLRDIYLRSQALYKLWFRSHLVCFSPEIFIRIEEGRVSGYPMKGTIDATLPNADKVLMADEKEAAEHATIVDLIRNDLSIVASQVRVPRYRYIDRLHTNKGDILQTSSCIEGILPDDYRQHLGDILFSQLPAGSITGAPKPKTVEIIRETEDYERGFYTGVMGICEAGRMESAVMIRFIEQEGTEMFFKAGGGITARSKWENEYNEIIQKAYVPIY